MARYASVFTASVTQFNNVTRKTERERSCVMSCVVYIYRVSHVYSSMFLFAFRFFLFVRCFSSVIELANIDLAIHTTTCLIPLLIHRGFFLYVVVYHSVNLWIFEKHKRWMRRDRIETILVFLILLLSKNNELEICV